MAMFNLLKIRTSTDIFKNEKCKVTFGLEHIQMYEHGHLCIGCAIQKKVYVI